MDAFTDIDSAEGETSSTESEDTVSNVTDTAVDTADNTDDAPVSEAEVSFATDSVRSTLPDTEEVLNQSRYEDSEGSNKADEVDARKLFRTPDLNELRYYSREGPYGKTIITKPIEDAFKHGFDIVGDYTERQDGDGMAKGFLDTFIPYYKMAKIKERRDGVCVLMHQIADAADSAAEPIDRASASWDGFQLWTVDNLSDELADTTVADHTEYDQDQIYVSEGAESGGIAIVDDISHPDHGDIVGYGIAPRQSSEDVQEVSFVHAERCQHFVNAEHVDGLLGNNVTGEHIGESVLTPVLQPLKGAQMGYWAMMRILHRYSAPLHAIEPPEAWGPEEWDNAQNQLEDISMASDAVLPPGSELSVAEGVSEFDPVPIYKVLVESICAGTVFTKSILQGTQSGTVAGSETDVKGYFDGIQVLREQEIAPDFRSTLKMVSLYDQSTVPRITDVDNIEFDWGPLFKPTDVEQAEGLVSVVTAATNAIKNYVLTPNEARSILEQEWAELDTDVDLDDLAEEDMDTLDRINMNEAGQGIHDNEPVNEENVRESPMNNSGGRPQGSTEDQSQPNRE